MHHLDIESEEKRQSKMTAAVRERAIEIRKARAEDAMDNFRRREPVVDEKPAVDWSEAPPEARYWSIDSDGKAYWCKSRPRLGGYGWVDYDNGVGRAPGFGWPAKRWKESLVERPYAEEPVADDYNAPTSHANRQTTEFERTPEGEVALEKLSQRFRQALDDTHDTVNSPAHYAKQGQIECIEVLEQLAEDGHDFRILNAIKYLWRYRHKGGVESLAKARWYIERVINEG